MNRLLIVNKMLNMANGLKIKQTDHTGQMIFWKSLIYGLLSESIHVYTETQVG